MSPHARRLSLGFLGPYLGLALVFALFSVLVWSRFGEAGLWRFLGPGNLRLIVVHASIPAAVALGMTLIMISGGIDLSVGYVVSLVTVVVVHVYDAAFHSPTLAAAASALAIAAGLAAALLVGLANGLLITQLGVVPFVVTLGMMGIAHGLGRQISGGQRLSFPGDRPDWVAFFGAIEPEAAWQLIGPAAWSVLLLAVLVSILLRRTVLGRHCQAIGSNELAARLCGVPVAGVKVVIYALAGLLTGWGGILQVARAGAGSHDVAAGLELEVIAAVVIGGGSLSGGQGTVSGTLVGALLITVLGNGCGKLQLPMEFRYVVIGALIIGVAAFNRWREPRL